MGQLQEKCWKDRKIALPATVKNITSCATTFIFSIFWTKIAIKVKNSSLLLHQSKNLYYLKKIDISYNSKKWPSKQLFFCKSLCIKLNFESHFLLLSRMANLSIIRYLLIWKILDNYYFNYLKKKLALVFLWSFKQYILGKFWTAMREYGALLDGLSKPFDCFPH